MRGQKDLRSIMKLYNGNVFDTHCDNIDYNVIEEQLGLAPYSIAGIYWNVDFYLYGRRPTYQQPDEAEYVNDVEVKEVVIEMLNGDDIIATQSQIEILEQYRPEDDEIYWNIVLKQLKLESGDE